MKVLYSVLRYQLLTDEFMNLGILFHNLATDERRFETISRWKRVQSFDDEVDIDMLKIITIGLKEEINNTLLNANYRFDIYQYPLKYVNELRFTKVCYAEVSNFNDFTELTKKNYLRYDYDKKLRPNRDEQVKIIKKLMKYSSIQYSAKKVLGEHSEKINYDYIIGKYGFKIFTFENTHIAKLVSSAKAWAFTAKEMEDKYQTIFLYDKDVDDKNFESVISILKKSGSRVIKIDDGMEFILSIFESIKNESKDEIKLR